MAKTKKESLKTKGEALVEFVLNRFEYSKKEMQSRHDKWREYYDDYRGTRSDNKEPWQCNYIIPTLKDVVRTKVPLYANILFSNGIKSFDIEPGEEGDEGLIPLLKDTMVYELENCGRNQGGFFTVMDGFLTQFEMYGYSVAKIPWRIDKDKGKRVFEGPDIEVVDIFSFYPDPGTTDVNNSWCVIRKRDVFVSYLKQLEAQEVYHSVKDLKDTSQPDDEYDPTLTKQPNDRVELLEYHGDIPKDLLEGKITDEAQVNIYEDDYVKALVTVANRKVCIRNVEYPYECGNIFVDASKDKMPNETFGVGTGEDIQALAEELTNAHNKLGDCVNLIANPMGVINKSKVSGVSGGIVISHPGKMFFAEQNVDDVRKAVYWFDTTAQAAALNPLIGFIQMLEEKIQKVTQAVPVISAMPSKKGLPETLGATLMMQGNAAEPIKHIVKHCLEPWFERVLEIIYKHNLQYFSKASASRVLGVERAKVWFEEKEKKEIRKEDIRLAGNPDFRPRGVSIFNEKQTEVENLINFAKVALGMVEPQTDPMGQPVIGADGKPIVQPVVDQKEMAKRIAEKMGIDDIEELIPALRELREAGEIRARTLREQRNQPAERPGQRIYPGGGAPAPEQLVQVLGGQR